MTPAEYDAWYDTPRGHWTGEREFGLARRLLDAPAGESLIDVGCGTGWFSRRFARDGYRVTGVDRNEAAIGFARGKSRAAEFMVADAQCLPFADGAFDGAFSIAALCFVDDERRAVAEIVRVARRRFVIGWLNRRSVLYRQKGEAGGGQKNAQKNVQKDSGAWTGARWHDAREVRALVDGLPVRDVQVRSAVFLPGGGWVARCVEPCMPAALPFGAMLFVAGSVVR